MTTETKDDKMISDEDWNIYRSEIRAGYRFGITMLIVILGGCGVMLIQQLVNHILG